MKTTKHSLNTKEMELIKQLIATCENTGDVLAMQKRLFAGTIEQMLEAEMEEHLGYEKNSVAGNNSGNSRNGYGKKTIISDFGECEIAVPRDQNGEFEPRIIAKRQTRTDEIEQKIQAMYAKGMSQRDIEDTVREIYGADVSQGMISRIRAVSCCENIPRCASGRNTGWHPPEVYPLSDIRFKERQRLTAAALHRFTAQPTPGRSSALPRLAALGVYPDLSTVKPFTRFIFQTQIVGTTLYSAPEYLFLSAYTIGKSVFEISKPGLNVVKRPHG